MRIERCTLCPRRCGALRDAKSGAGVCKMPALPVLARAGLHFYEEPCISGSRGSGAVFFSGCSLGCVFCQNYEISAGRYGKTVTVERLADIFRELEAAGAHNINLVNPPILRRRSGRRSTSIIRACRSSTTPGDTSGWRPCEAWRGMWMSICRI